MRILPVVGALILLAGCAGAPRVAEKSYRLAYGGNPGQLSRYAADQTLRGRVSTQGMPQLVAIKTKSSISQTVKEILQDGRRREELDYGIISLEINGALLEIDETWREMRAELVRAPNGAVEEERESQSSGEMLAWISRSLETFFPVFPEKPVRIGERWNRSSRTGGGKDGIAMKMSVTFDGLQDVDGIPCVILKIEGSAGGSEVSSAGELSDLDLEFSGVAQFDPDGGRLLRARQRGSLRVRAKAQGVAVEARLNFIAQIKLMPEP